MRKRITGLVLAGTLMLGAVPAVYAQTETGNEAGQQQETDVPWGLLGLLGLAGLAGLNREKKDTTRTSAQTSAQR